MKKLIFILFSFHMFVASYNLCLACDRSSLEVVSLVANSDGTYTYNFFICVETKADWMIGNQTQISFTFPASGAKILGLSPSGSISFLNGTAWSISGLSTTTAMYSGAALDFDVPVNSPVTHPTNSKRDSQCFKFSVILDKNPNIGFFEVEDFDVLNRYELAEYFGSRRIN